MITAHTALKEATKDLHAELDSMPAMRQLMRQDLTLDQYSEVLLHLESWLHEMSAHLHLRSRPSFAAIDRKLIALRTDLENLGESRPTLKLHLASTDPYYALGVHYVIEGSTMGARILAPRIETTLGRTDITHFYRLYGEDTLANWAETIDLLEQELVDQCQRDRAVEGASTAFRSLIERFSMQVQPLPTLERDLLG